jgi:hypothetical protein
VPASPWASRRPRAEPPALGLVRRLSPVLVAAVVAGLYLLIDPPSADLAAQTYRTWLFEHAGFAIWDNGWYAGHHVPAYSILFPPLAALLGPRVVGALAAVAAAWAFDRLVTGLRGDDARPAAVWFALGTGVALVTGRLTFALGLAFGVAAVLALARGRWGLCALLAAGTALASPVAAAFLAIALAAWGWTGRRRAGTLPRTVALLAAALVPALALGVLFPEGGDFPFAADAFFPSLAATLLVLVALPRTEKTLRLGVALYAVVLVVSAALSTPMGGNAVRLGAVFAGPVAAWALWPARRGLLLLLVLPLLYWQWSAPVDDYARASSDPSATGGSYYAGLNRFLDTRKAAQPPFRVEIPFTDNHWEASRVATHVPLARGWERQLDRKVNPLFYDDRPLTPRRYRRWLDDMAVAYVALADAPVDYSAAEEAALVRTEPSYLREVWHDAHWRVFAVRRPAPLAAGAASATRITPETVELRATRPGRVALRVRWSPYWALGEGRGCVVRDGDWTALELRAAGPVRLVPRFALDRVGSSRRRCSG